MTVVVPRRHFGRYVVEERAISSPCNTGLHLRSEEHTSELQSQSNLVCRLLLEKKKKTQSFIVFVCLVDLGILDSAFNVLQHTSIGLLSNVIVEKPVPAESAFTHIISCIEYIDI